MRKLSLGLIWLLSLCCLVGAAWSAEFVEVPVTTFIPFLSRCRCGSHCNGPAGSPRIHRTVGATTMSPILMLIAPLPSCLNTEFL